MHRIATQISRDVDVQASLMVHAIIEDAALNGDDTVPEQMMLRLVDQSLTVLGLLNSYPFERNFVVATDLEVFEDQELTRVQHGRRAVLLRTVGTDGAETIRAFLTSRPVYYKPGMLVGYEWRVNPPPKEGDGFVADPVTGAAIHMIGWDFHGRDLSSFTGA